MRNKWHNAVYLVFIAIMSSCFVSCDDFEGEQKAAAYLQIKGFKIVENPNANFQVAQDEGFLTSKINDVWLTVTIDNEEKFLGVYSLKDGGINIPVLANGPHKIKLQAGIKINGMAGTRSYYPFYKAYEDTVTFIEGKITKLDTIELMYDDYRTEISRFYTFEGNENPFENSDAATNSSNTKICVITSDSVAYGDRCAAFYSNSSSDNYIVVTKDSIYLNNVGNTIILEMDYDANIPFEVGLCGKKTLDATNSYISCMRILPKHNGTISPHDKRNWQKIYISLANVWDQLENQPFKLWLSPKNTSNVSNGFVHIDNIKILHYPE